MTTAITFQNVSVCHEPGGPVVLDAISFVIPPGEHVALVGLNGAGKTTLLYAAVGLVPFEGAISILGTPLSSSTERTIRDRTGFLFSVPDDQILFPNVLDDVAYTLERKGIPRSEARRESIAVMESLGIAQLASRAPHRLSHGQRQRVALAGALVADPPLLLLDEPSAALDPAGKEDLAGLLIARNAAMLIATHDLAFARRVCTRFIVLANGVVAEDVADPERITHYRDHRYSSGPSKAR
ncbi:MAG: ABC transporter ATP-binding protein [Planctomycetota bacterium]